MSETNHADDLVTLKTYPTEFEAHHVVALLEDSGIDAVAFGAIRQSLPLSAKFTGVPVQVKRGDLDRARDILAANDTDSDSIDWDEVDVGERADDLPLKSTERVPVLVLMGYVVAILAMIVMVVALADFLGSLIFSAR